MISLKPATIEDSYRLFNWRNDDYILQNSELHKKVSWCTHIKWLNDFLHGRGLIWIIEPDAGMVRVEVKDKAYLSIYLFPEWQGKGLGTHIISTVTKIATQGLDMPIYARILADNTVSLRAFQRAGYRLWHKEAGIVEAEHIGG